MDMEEVERLAREAGLKDNEGDGDWWADSPDEALHRFAELVNAAALERAALLAASFDQANFTRNNAGAFASSPGASIAAAIRALARP